jgi:hypothetical protein
MTVCNCYKNSLLSIKEIKRKLKELLIQQVYMNYTTLHFGKFFQMISQKYVLLNRFFALIPEMASIFIHHVKFLHRIGVYVLQLLLI